jgi:hypothetical protein
MSTACESWTVSTTDRPVSVSTASESWTVSTTDRPVSVSTASESWTVSTVNSPGRTEVHFSKAAPTFYAQIHKLDKPSKSGKLWGPIAGLQLCFLMGYTSASTSLPWKHVSPSSKKHKNRKNGSRKRPRFTKIDQNRPKMEKRTPAK